MFRLMNQTLRNIMICFLDELFHYSDPCLRGRVVAPRAIRTSQNMLLPAMTDLIDILLTRVLHISALPCRAS